MPRGNLRLFRMNLAGAIRSSGLLEVREGLVEAVQIAAKAESAEDVAEVLEELAATHPTA